MWSDEGHADGADDADLDLFGLGFRRFRQILLITCRILAFFLVVSQKKRNFGGRFQLKILKENYYGYIG